MSWVTLAPVASAITATIAFVWQVTNSVITRNRESNRRDWERLQILAQILHQGPEKGLWAQRIAIKELAQLKTKKQQALLLSRDVLDFWNKSDNIISPELKSELQRVHDKLQY